MTHGFSGTLEMQGEDINLSNKGGALISPQQPPTVEG